MARALPILLGAAALTGVALVAGAASAAGSSGSTSKSGSGWVDADAPRRIRAYASAIEERTGWWGLADYLAATAYTESRGDSRAVGDSGRAWGWFQMHNTSKCMIWLDLDGPELLGDEGLQVAVAACHAYRLGSIYSVEGQVVQWRDIRRGWKFPKWVARQYRDAAKTERNERNFVKGLAAVGLPADFRFADAFPPGMRMLPIETLVAIVREAGVA